MALSPARSIRVSMLSTYHSREGRKLRGSQRNGNARVYCLRGVAAPSPGGHLGRQRLGPGCRHAPPLRSGHHPCPAHAPLRQHRRLEHQLLTHRVVGQGQVGQQLSNCRWARGGKGRRPGVAIGWAGTASARADSASPSNSSSSTAGSPWPLRPPMSAALSGVHMVKSRSSARRRMDTSPSRRQAMIVFWWRLTAAGAGGRVGGREQGGFDRQQVARAMSFTAQCKGAVSALNSTTAQQPAEQQRPASQRAHLCPPPRAPLPGAPCSPAPGT